MQSRKVVCLNMFVQRLKIKFCALLHNPPTCVRPKMHQPASKIMNGVNTQRSDEDRAQPAIYSMTHAQAPQVLSDIQGYGLYDLDLPHWLNDLFQAIISLTGALLMTYVSQHTIPAAEDFGFLSRWRCSVHTSMKDHKNHIGIKMVLWQLTIPNPELTGADEIRPSQVYDNRTTVYHISAVLHGILVSSPNAIQREGRILVRQLQFNANLEATQRRLIFLGDTVHL